MSWFRVDRCEDVAYVRISDFIGVDGEAAECIAEIGDAKRVELSIDSHGGSALAARELVDAIRGRTPVATITGTCGSAAVLIMLAADRVRIVRKGKIMIHPPSASVFAQAPGLRSAAEELDVLTAQIVDLLAKRTADAELVRTWFAGPDVWLDSDAAWNSGLVDEVFDPPKPKRGRHARALVESFPRESGNEAFFLEYLQAFGPIKCTSRAKLYRELQAYFGLNVQEIAA